MILTPLSYTRIFSSATRSFQTSIFFWPPISVVRIFTGESQLTLMCAITLLREINRNERNVFHSVQMFFTGRHDGLRLTLDQVIHDGEIVRRQVPDHADVVLEQSEVHAQRIVIVQIAEMRRFRSVRGSCEPLR